MCIAVDGYSGEIQAAGPRWFPTCTDEQINKQTDPANWLNLLLMAVSSDLVFYSLIGDIFTMHTWYLFFMHFPMEYCSVSLN